MSRSLLLLVVLGVVGCGGSQAPVRPVPYTAQSDRIAKAPETLKALLLADVQRMADSIHVLTRLARTPRPARAAAPAVTPSSEI
ncbi:MAG TPA: hypothetical protein VGC42_03680 [Kofleriaceae bacterium]